MKKFAAISAVALATLAGAASASVTSNEIDNYVPGVDVSTLTNAQIAEAVTIIHGGDDEGEKRLQLRALLK